MKTIAMEFFGEFFHLTLLLGEQNIPSGSLVAEDKYISSLTLKSLYCYCRALFPGSPLAPTENKNTWE